MSSLTTYAPGDAQAMGTRSAPRAGVLVLAGCSAAFVALMGVVALPAYMDASSASFDVASLAWLVAAGILVPVGLATVARRFVAGGATTSMEAAGVDAPAMAMLRPQEPVAAAQAAGRDALTGLLERDGFAEELARQVELATEGGYPLSLAVLDVDQLARTNEKLGREAGDRLLAAIGRLVGEQTRMDDHAFRLGGDEFAILMPRCGAGRAQSVLRRLLLAALEAGDDRGDAPEWSFSAGISSYPELSAGGSALRRDAQAALGWAKQHGRTDVQLFDAFRDLSDEERRHDASGDQPLPAGDDDFTSGELDAPPIQLRFLGAEPASAPTREWVDPRLVMIGLAEAPDAGGSRRSSPTFQPAAPVED